LIVGGGIAGIAAALNLAERGVFVNIADSAPYIGGRAVELCCKGITRCVRCDVCLSRDKLYELARNPNIRIFSGTEVQKVTGKPGDFRVTLRRRGRYVDERACTACGLCTEACPVEGGAIIPAGEGIPRTYSVVEEKCIHLKGGECQKCLDVCPNGAISFSPQSTSKRLNVGAIIVAVGYEPYNPVLDPRLGYGEISDVLTSLELENILKRHGKVRVPSTGKEPGRIAFIQCVGSRDEKRGVNYCSKVCCKYTYGLIALLRSQYPDLEISLFFMDWRPYAPERDDIYLLSETDENTHLIRSRPAEIVRSSEGKPAVRFVDSNDNSPKEEPFDMVILSIGIAPSRELISLSQTLKIQLDEFGFIQSDGRPTVTTRPGVFACGCCRGPADIEESFMDGLIAAGEAVTFLEGLS